MYRSTIQAYCVLKNKKSRAKGSKVCAIIIFIWQTVKIRIRLGKLRIQSDPDPKPRLATKCVLTFLNENKLVEKKLPRYYWKASFIIIYS